jgi:actin-like ATPase involved in cell morphogenesis
MSAFVTPPQSVAIDFGASATKSAWRDQAGTIHLVRFGPAVQFESVVHVSRDLTVSVLSAGGSARQLYGVKQRIGEPGSPLLEREIPVGASDESVPLIEPTIAILAHALANCRKACDTAWEEVPLVLTHPVLWGEPERQFLSEALRMSSLPLRWDPAAIHFVTEPEAACAYAVSQGIASFADGPIAVFDIGAATLDVAVISRDGEDSVTLASDGSFSGGDDLDSALLRLVEKRLRTEHGPGASAAFLRACREQPYSARGEARKTKEALSAELECTFAATLAGDGDGTNVDVDVERYEFEEEIGAILGRWTALLGECLASLPSATTPGTIVCSGGTALIPALLRKLDDIAQEAGARLAVLGSEEIGPGQCIAPGALEVILARETAKLREQERQRIEKEERRAARRRRERQIRRHNERLIDDAIKDFSSLRGRADALLDRLPSDEELITVIRCVALIGGFTYSAYLLSGLSLIALSHDRMTIEPVIGDGYWRQHEVKHHQNSAILQNRIIQFGKDRIWVGSLNSAQWQALRDWADGDLY